MKPEQQLSEQSNRPWWCRPATPVEIVYWLLGFVTGLYSAWPKGRRS